MKEAAATAAAFSLLLAEEDKARAQAGGESLLCGVVGVGVHGRELLTQLAGMKNAQVVAICDPYAPSIKKATEIAGEVATYDDYRKMLDQEKPIQAVLVATPLHLHTPVCLEALKAGKHVICEPPLGLSVEQCKELAKAASDSGKVFQVGHQRRSSPLYRHALNFIKNGLIGDMTHVRSQWHRNESWRKAVPNPDQEKLVNWRLYKESSGGLMAEYGSHQIDVANWYTKSVPRSVVGIGGIDRWKDGREVNDNVQVIYEYPSGVKMVYTSILSNTHWSEFDEYIGTDGAIRISRQQKGLLFKEPEAIHMGWEELAHKEQVGDEQGIILDPNATRLVKPEEEAAVKAEIARSDFRRELEDFVLCIREGKQPASTVSDGLRSSVAALKANEAMEKGTRVKLGEELFTL